MIPIRLQTIKRDVIVLDTTKVIFLIYKGKCNINDLVTFLIFDNIVGDPSFKLRGTKDTFINPSCQQVFGMIKLRQQPEVPCHLRISVFWILLNRFIHRKVV